MTSTTTTTTVFQQRCPLGSLATLLICFGALALLFEASTVRLSNKDEKPADVFLIHENAQHRASQRSGGAEEEQKQEEDELDSWMRATGADAEVPSTESLHLSVLQATCLKQINSVIPWTYGKSGVATQMNEVGTPSLLIDPDDLEVLEKLRECPDIDIYLPATLRGHGYCEDAIAYAKFLKSRLLPKWVLETPFFDEKLDKNVTYYELCPKTPVIFFNHYWDDMPNSPSWPKQKPVYLMPNVEMYELTAEHYWRVDVVLCKTHTCYDRVSKWYEQEGNPRGARVIYTRHTTSDVANFATHALGNDKIRPKDFVNVKFIHTAGTSVQKGTRHLLDCWLSRPDFPQLDLFINERWYEELKPHFDERIRASSNVNVTNHRVDPITFGKAIAEASFFLCPSVMEGYGHYINQARASGGVIITTDAAPMNELISSEEMGRFVEPNAIGKDGHMLLAGAYTGDHGLQNVEGLTAHISKEGVCSAVEQVLYNTTVWGRQAMAAKAREQYHIDTKFFALEMVKLRELARQQELSAPPSTWKTSNLRQEQADR